MPQEWRFPNRATPPGSSAYYSVRFAPAGLRHELAALLAWRHQVWAISNEVSDPGVARLKLQWWREELERTYRGEPRHPLSHALEPALARNKLPAGPFLRIADRAEAEILRRQPRDEAALRSACADDQGALFELMARCHGKGYDLPYARRLGTFCARVYLIRDSGLRARRGRLLFPTESLRERGLSAEALRERSHRAHLPGLLAEAAAEARRELRETGRGAAGAPSCVRVRFVILKALLDELERSGFDLADHRVALTPLRKLWLGWRESLRR
jgi:phytoene synthase